MCLKSTWKIKHILLTGSSQTNNVERDWETPSISAYEFQRAGGIWKVKKQAAPGGQIKEIKKSRRSFWVSQTVFINVNALQRSTNVLHLPKQQHKSHCTLPLCIAYFDWYSLFLSGTCLHDPCVLYFFYLFENTNILCFLHKKKCVWWSSINAELFFYLEVVAWD